MLGDDLEALGLGETGNGGALGVNAKPGASLLAGRNSEIARQRLGDGGTNSISLCKRRYDGLPR
jgi:hypothetical protein